MSFVKRKGLHPSGWFGKKERKSDSRGLEDLLAESKETTPNESATSSLSRIPSIGKVVSIEETSASHRPRSRTQPPSRVAPIPPLPARPATISSTTYPSTQPLPQQPQPQNSPPKQQQPQLPPAAFLDEDGSDKLLATLNAWVDSDEEKEFIPKLNLKKIIRFEEEQNGETTTTTTTTTHKKKGGGKGSKKKGRRGSWVEFEDERQLLAFEGALKKSKSDSELGHITPPSTTLKENGGGVGALSDRYGMALYSIKEEQEAEGKLIKKAILKKDNNNNNNNNNNKKEEKKSTSKEHLKKFKGRQKKMYIRTDSYTNHAQRQKSKSNNKIKRKSSAGEAEIARPGSTTTSPKSGPQSSLSLKKLPSCSSLPPLDSSDSISSISSNSSNSSSRGGSAGNSTSSLSAVLNLDKLKKQIRYMTELSIGDNQAELPLASDLKGEFRKLKGIP